MKNAFRKTGLALALAATTLALSSPAAARDGDYYDRGNNNDAALAIGAGILGLVVGAAIASDNDHRRYDDRRYYQDRRYYPRNYRYDNRRYDNRRHDRYRDYRSYRGQRNDHYNRSRRGYRY